MLMKTQGEQVVEESVKRYCSFSPPFPFGTFAILMKTTFLFLLVRISECFCINLTLFCKPDGFGHWCPPHETHLKQINRCDLTRCIIWRQYSDEDSMYSYECNIFYEDNTLMKIIFLWKQYSYGGEVCRFLTRLFRPSKKFSWGWSACCT